MLTLRNDNNGLRGASSRKSYSKWFNERQPLSPDQQRKARRIFYKASSLNRLLWHFGLQLKWKSEILLHEELQEYARKTAREIKAVRRQLTKQADTLLPNVFLKHLNLVLVPLRKLTALQKSQRKPQTRRGRQFDQAVIGAAVWARKRERDHLERLKRKRARTATRKRLNAQ